MDKQSRIYVAGHKGLVGSALIRRLNSENYTNIISRSKEQLDLKDTHAVNKFFAEEKPEFVFLAAAKVGGIHANNTFPADFIYENLMIQNNIIHASHLNGVKKLLFLGSSCIYPKLCPQPIKEDYLLSGLLEPTNEPYAIAKIAGIKMCQSYNRQYGTDFVSVMPTNLYGPQDNFDLNSSHVLPALIRKFHEAKIANQPHVKVWGSGTPRREFLFVDDLADACLFIMNHYHGSEIVNIGTGKDVTIRELASLIKDITKYSGEINWNTAKPDGTPQKLLDVTKLTQIGWQAQVSLHDGIKRTYEWYVNQSGINLAG